MKHTKKLKTVAVTLVVTLLMTVFSVGAFGLEDILGGLGGASDLSGLGDILSGFNLEDFDINKILDSFSQSDYSGILGSIISSLGDEYAGFTNNEIIVALGKVINDLIANGGDVSKIDFNSSEIIAMIGKYLKQGKNDETTGEAESTLLSPESSTAENTKPPESEAESRAPATSASKPSTNPPAYQGSPSYPVISDPTTAPPATEYYSYVTQESVTQALLTESPSYAVTDKNDNGNSEKGVTKQMVIGIIILIISAAAVVVVAVFLKKNRE